MNLTQHVANEINKNKIHIPLSGVTSYHLLSGSLTLANSVIITGMSTTLYTGNGATQSVVTGVDMATQWGNSASETFGGLIWGKLRNGIGSNQLLDTVRGATFRVYSDLTNAQDSDTNGLTAFTSSGFNVGASTSLNNNTSTYASWNFQTTHRTSGTTNHGKAYTCHYNPFTGFTIIKYEGSGLAGHEIPHYLGRKLGFYTTKNLSAVGDWNSGFGNATSLYLNLTNAQSADASIATLNTDNSIVGGVANTSTNQYIMYGWANSYFDEANTLIGNYEAGIYQSNGIGTKVTTRGKPAWVMIKRLDSTGSWLTVDNIRTPNKDLYVNLSNAEATSNLISFQSDGFTILTTSNDGGGTAGGQYLYMVVYDNDSGSGKSKYPRATDTSALNLNAIVPFANGIDANGVKNTVLTKNETVAGLTLTQGKNYVYSKNDGLYGVSTFAPQYHTYNGFGDYFDVSKNQWFNSPSAYSNDGTAISGFTAVNGTLVSTNGALVLTNGTTVIGYAHNLLTLTSGRKYRVKLNRSSGNDSWAVKVGTTANGVDTYTSGTLTASGEFTFDFVAVATNYLTISNITGTTGLINTFDTVVVYPINNDGSVDTSSATAITESRNYLNAIVYADAGGQPTYIEQLPKIEYKDVVKANEYQGKNACTAWVNFDGTTTPPTIRDSFNVSAVIRTATGVFDIYFKTPMNNTEYTTNGHAEYPGQQNRSLELSGAYQYQQLAKFTAAFAEGASWGLINSQNCSVQVFGGNN